MHVHIQYTTWHTELQNQRWKEQMLSTDNLSLRVWYEQVSNCCKLCAHLKTMSDRSHTCMNENGRTKHLSTIHLSLKVFDEQVSHCCKLSTHLKTTPVKDHTVYDWK